MKILAIIPARAGSKGIPGKNIRSVAGRSLLGWSIVAAKASRFPMRVVVSTDGQAIAEEATRQGAEVVMRPDAIAGDLASSEQALLHVLGELALQNYVPDLTVFLQCTSPLTSTEDIDGTIQKLFEENADSAFSACRFFHFLWRPGPDGDWSGVNHDKRHRLMRQQRPAEYLETGAVYVFRTDGFIRAKHRFFGKTVAYETPAERCWEIDEPHDLLIAEFLIKKQANSPQMINPRGIVFDFDGVMTDNSVMVDQDGRESVRCDRSDGMGIELLRKSGIPLLILSKERNPVVAARAKKLQISAIQGIDDKLSYLKQWSEETGVSLKEICYVGNDINDLECMQAVGWPVAVADAHSAAKSAAKHVLSCDGGRGAVRELAEMLLNKKF